jgi:ElaB/YqjD/DUF883 family membrane-anchored ribosome-binding protein
MAEQPHVIREQIRETQESLASKLSTLEDKVVNTVTDTTATVAETVENVKETVTGTVEAVKETVTDTIESVKGTVESTVATVKRTFDLNHQVQERPWLMMAGSCAAGFLAGRLLPGAARSAATWASHRAAEGIRSPRASFSEAAAPRSNGEAKAKGPGWFHQLTDQFHEEIEQVKGLALGALFGLVRDWAMQELPAKLAPQVEEMIDNVTTKLGGTRIEGPVLETLAAKSTRQGSRSEAQTV